MSESVAARARRLLDGLTPAGTGYTALWEAAPELVRSLLTEHDEAVALLRDWVGREVEADHFSEPCPASNQGHCPVAEARAFLARVGEREGINP